MIFKRQSGYYKTTCSAPTCNGKALYCVGAFAFCREHRHLAISLRRRVSARLDRASSVWAEQYKASDAACIANANRWRRR